MTSEFNKLPADGAALLQRAEAVATAARDRGALQSIATAFETLEQDGIRYALRVVDNLRRKQAASAAQSADKPANPFLPYEPALYVAHVSPGHVLLLNKFNVIEPHLLLVTAGFESQRAPLSLADFEAAAQLNARLDGLLFYNGGGRAGASQPHKHLQWVPRALRPDVPGLPVDTVITPVLSQSRIQHVDALPFAHALQARAPTDTPAMDHARYCALLRAVSIDPDAADGVCENYNWLMTRRWMMVVPRTQERWDGMSVNALAFAGALLARDAAEATRIREAGPAAILSAVTRQAGVSGAP
ncbi:phosphorylase [Sinimarinibacterium sp. CAU 1509]|uniref:phosphorylase n=1 Tax=Sinimarinibacterium sp. CAU 1509 TaxID=2562283 RepID=UPI00146EF90C|nr:phosphorylase [Sinimarinibacterium sp. CAU 1509]